ncbi:MAG: arginine--tRNA ligase [bacterium]
MTIKSLLNERFLAAMKAADIPENFSPVIAASTRAGFGDFQANGAMAAAKRLKTNPRELAQKICDHLDLSGIASKTEIAGPGFINIFLDDSFIAKQLSKTDPITPTEQQTVVVDYSGPNLAKEMHVGHLRSTIIGDCLARILEKLGHRVIRQNHMGDWGTQFGMLIAELEQQVGKGEKPELALSDLETFYQQAKQHFDADPDFADLARSYVVRLQSGDDHCQALWRQFIDISIAHSEDIYGALNVSLTHADIRAESAYNDDLPEIVSALENQGLAVEDNGAKVIFLEELADKNGNPSPVIIQKSDGGYLYATTDLAALRYRAQTLAADRLMYFIDARQSLHMKQVFTTARKAGFVGENVKLEHLAFGTMMGADGKPFKTRDGGTVKLKALLEEAVSRADTLIASRNPDMPESERNDIARKVGIGAVKYADLSKTRTNDYLFSWDAMLSFEGNTAPYLQYAYTRVRSIFRKANCNPDALSADLSINAPAERALALKLLQLDEIIDQVAADAQPHTLCSYLYDVASAYMSFYEQCPIMKDGIDSAIRNSRLMLCKLTADTLKDGLCLLGIDVMERM